jgi:hypothetical protein
MGEALVADRRGRGTVIAPMLFSATDVMTREGRAGRERPGGAASGFVGLVVFLGLLELSVQAADALGAPRQFRGGLRVRF